MSGVREMPTLSYILRWSFDLQRYGSKTSGHLTLAPNDSSQLSLTCASYDSSYGIKHRLIKHRR